MFNDDFEELLDSTFTVTRTTTVKNPVTKVMEPKKETTEPFPCRIGKSTGTFTQGSPQGKITKGLILYTVINADIKEGDIADTEEGKYIVGNVYRPARHHIECDVTAKKE